jgi:hypothetical protein
VFIDGEPSPGPLGSAHPATTEDEMAWTWRYEDVDGREVGGPESEDFGSQSDAETWLGQSWRELAEAGIAQVTLREGEENAYTMSLEAPE